LEINRKSNKAKQDSTVSKFQRGYDIINNDEYKENQITRELQINNNRTKNNISVYKQPPSDLNLGHEIPDGVKISTNELRQKE